MTDVWIDPVELDAMATVISQQSQRAQDAFAADLGLRDVDLPAHLAWVREEGAALAQEAAVATLAYLLNGIDLGVRAEAVRAEQATVTDVAAPTEVQPQGFLLSGSPQLDPQVAAILNAPSGQGFVLDQMIGPDGQVRTGSGGIDFRALARLTAGGGAGGVAHFPDLPKSPFLAGRNESYNPATNTIDFDLDKFYENKAIDEKAIERSLERE